MQASRLLIVEDHPILADALRTHLRLLLPAYQCLLAKDLAGGLELLQQHAPIAMVLLDLNLPDSQGIDTLNAFCERRAEGPMLVFSSFQAPSLKEICASNRVTLLPKSAPTARLMAVLLQTLSAQSAGNPVFTAQRLTDTSVDTVTTLSRHQHIVLSKLAHGKNCACIAHELQISEGTVRSHLHTIYLRLGVSNKSQACTGDVGRRFAGFAYPLRPVCNESFANSQKSNLAVLSGHGADSGNRAVLVIRFVDGVVAFIDPGQCRSDGGNSDLAGVRSVDCVDQRMVGLQEQL